MHGWERSYGRMSNTGVLQWEIKFLVYDTIFTLIKLRLNNIRHATVQWIIIKFVNNK